MWPKEPPPHEAAELRHSSWLCPGMAYHLGRFDPPLRGLSIA